MIRRPPITTRTYTLCPYTTLFLSDFTNPGLVGDRPTFISQLSGEGEAALRALNGLLVFRRTKTEPEVAACPTSRSVPDPRSNRPRRSEEHTSELQSLMRISYAVLCLKKKTNEQNSTSYIHSK